MGEVIDVIDLSDDDDDDDEASASLKNLAIQVLAK